MKHTSLFWNRQAEIQFIQSRLRRGGLGYLTGRRRIGKTALLKRICSQWNGLYHQAVEGTPDQQLLHLCEEWSARIPILGEIRPRSWGEFFKLISTQKLPKLIVLDEFPYWTAADPGFASHFQKWVDHHLPSLKCLVLVSGSSQSMLDSHFLGRQAALFGRSIFHLRIKPMSYRWFCKALGFSAQDPQSFTRFTMVGGVPHYWKLIHSASVLEQADELYFNSSAMLTDEPSSWLRDEGISGHLSKAALDLVGRGVRKPSELASRLAVPQGNLSRPLSVLLELGFMRRELPFGESSRSTKKVLYNIEDPALSFYYGTYLPHRALWATYPAAKKMQILELHASGHWENLCRRSFAGSNRYWSGKSEIDLVAPLPDPKEGYLVGECKWAWVDKKVESRLLEDLKTRFEPTELGQTLKKKYPITYRIFSKKDLSTTANLEKS